MTNTDRNTLTLQTSNASTQVGTVLLQQAAASGADLTAPRRLTVNLRSRMNVRIDAPLKKCLSLMGGLTGSMAAPAGQKTFLSAEHGVVVDASEIIAMVISPVPSK